MRYFLAATLALALSAPASASLEIFGGLNSTDIPGVNNFKDALEGHYASGHVYDIDKIFNGGANVRATVNGTLYFFYHAAESGFTNEFVIGGSYDNPTNKLLGGTALYAENITGTPSGTTQISFEYPTGLAIAQPTPVGYNILAGQSFSDLGIGFRVSAINGVTGTNPVDALAGMQGFGVFYNTATYANSNKFDELFFGFDDNGAGPDDNHDDMIVRAVFVPEPRDSEVVPEPASLATWCALVVLGAITVCGAKRRNE